MSDIRICELFSDPRCIVIKLSATVADPFRFYGNLCLHSNRQAIGDCRRPVAILLKG